MTRFHNFLHKLWMPVAASMLAVLISGSTAQTPPAMAILNGLLNGVGVVLGGRKKLSTKTPRTATPGLAAT